MLSTALYTAILISIVHNTLAMTRRERLLFKVLNADNLRNSVREQAAILIQSSWRSYQRCVAHKCNVSPADKLISDRKLSKDCPHLKQGRIECKTDSTLVEITESESEHKTDPVCKESCTCVHVYEKTVQAAVLLFRKVRNKNLFVDDQMTDVVDLGISQMEMSNRVGYIETRVDAIEETQMLIKNDLSEMKRELSVFQNDLNDKFILLMDAVKKNS